MYGLGAGELRVMSNALKPHDISLEILETIFLDEPEEKSSSTIRQLQEAGFRIELDDFGTGRTSIANLTKFPVSKLKIDRHFIQNIDSDEDRQSITRALIGFARELNIEPLAEGVETPEEMTYLQKLGCQAMQGYYFAQPMQLEHAIRWCCERDSGLRPHLVRVA